MYAPWTVLALTLASASAPPDRPYALMVGDPAPKLEVAEWVRGGPVPRFEPGMVYVLDCFATWCGPCVDAMPVLSAMQKRYRGKVTFIAVDVWDYPERVGPFLKKMGEKLDYAVCVDRLPSAPPPGTDNVPMWAAKNGATSQAFLAASGWEDEGVPVLFVVDQKGRLAWVGDDPKELESVLVGVLNETWDLDRRAAAYAERMAKTKQARVWQSELRAASRAKEWDKALRAADRLLAFDHEYDHYAGFKFQTLLLEVKKKEEAYAFARGQLATNRAPQAFGQMAYVITFMLASPAADDLRLAEQLATHADKLAKGERAGPLETLARLAFLRGDTARAVELQTRAIAKMRSEESKKEGEKTLAKYRGG